MKLSLSSSSNNNNNNNNNNIPGRSAAADDDSSRRKRLETVLKIISAKPGRISEEGIERLSRRCGFDNMWEEEVRTGRRTLQMAGSGMLIGVEFRAGSVDAVAVDFAAERLGKWGVSTAGVLKRDLTMGSEAQAGFNAGLERFAGNLERLAVLERLSVAGAECAEAVVGIYECLRRLFEGERGVVFEERGALRRDSGGGVERRRLVEREVMCRHSGRPRMNVHGRVGLSVDYWASAPLPTDVKDDDDNNNNDIDVDADADGTHEDTKDEAEDDETGLLFSALISCEETLPQLYPTIRTSSEWISPNVLVGTDVQGIDLLPPSTSAANTTANMTPDWQDPPLAPAASTTQQSHARFVAHLHPPLVVPLQIAVQIYASLGVDISGEILAPGDSLDGLLLRPSASSTQYPQKTQMQTTPQQMRAYRFDRTLTVPLPSTHTSVKLEIEEAGNTTGPLTAETEDGRVTYATALYTTTPNLARRIEALPFAHPRQFIELLPVLRVWAAVGAVLGATFGGIETRGEGGVGAADGGDGRGGIELMSQKANVKANGNNAKVKMEGAGGDAYSIRGNMQGETDMDVDAELAALMRDDDDLGPDAQSVSLGREDLSAEKLDTDAGLKPTVWNSNRRVRPRTWTEWDGTTGRKRKLDVAFSLLPSPRFTVTLAAGTLACDGAEIAETAAAARKRTKYQDTKLHRAHIFVGMNGVLDIQLIGSGGGGGVGGGDAIDRSLLSNRQFENGGGAHMDVDRDHGEGKDVDMHGPDGFEDVDVTHTNIEISNNNDDMNTKEQGEGEQEQEQEQEKNQHSHQATKERNITSDSSNQNPSTQQQQHHRRQQHQEKKQKALLTALEICGFDLAVWCEWLLRRGLF